MAIPPLVLSPSKGRPHRAVRPELVEGSSTCVQPHRDCQPPHRVRGRNDKVGTHESAEEVSPPPAILPEGLGRQGGNDSEMIGQLSGFPNVADDAEGLSSQIRAQRDVVDGATPLESQPPSGDVQA